MPIDPSIPFGARTFSLGNTFMDAMQQGGQARIQQSQMRAQQTLDDERRQKLKEAQNAEAEQQKFYAIVSKPGQTPDGAAEEIRTTVPSLYQPYLKQRAELDAKAGEISKAKAETKKLQTEIATKGQEYAAPFLQLVEKAQYNPDAFAFALNTIKSHFDDFPVEQMLAQAGGDPAKIKQIIDGFKSPQQQQADTAAASGAARLPGEQAASAQALRTLAGTSPTGITAAQAATNANAAANTRIAGANLSLAQQREKREAEKQQLTYGAGVTENGQPLPVDPTAKAIAEYRVPPPSARSMAAGPGKALMDRVIALNPDFNATEFPNRQKTRIAFTTGDQGKKINAINTAIGHLDQLGTAVEALANGDTQIVNQAKNYLMTQFGSDKVTNFDTIKDALAGEISNVLSNSGATVAGIADAQSHIKNAGSPAQLAGYVKTQIPILGSKLASYDYQYHQAMGDKDPFSALSPDAKAVLSKHGFDPAHPTIGGGGGSTGTIRARDPQGKLHEAPAGTPLPTGWKREGG